LTSAESYPSILDDEFLLLFKAFFDSLEHKKNSDVIVNYPKGTVVDSDEVLIMFI